MTQYYLLLLLSTLLMSAQFAASKLYQSKNGSAIKTSLLFTTLSGLFNGAIFFCIGGFSISVTPFSLICAAGVAALCLGYNLIGFRIFELGSFSVYTMFLMLGGMLLPFLYGMIFLGDSAGLGLPALICRVTGVMLMTCSLALPCIGKLRAKEQRSRLFIPLCILVFVMNGFVSIISKLHQIEPAAAVDPIGFVFLSNTLNGLASGIILLILCVRSSSKPELAKDFPAADTADRLLRSVQRQRISFTADRRVVGTSRVGAVPDTDRRLGGAQRDRRTVILRRKAGQMVACGNTARIRRYIPVSDLTKICPQKRMTFGGINFYFLL